MAERDIAKAVVEAFRAEGIEYVFGLAGWHVMPIYDVLADAPDIQLVTVKCENSAATMADVYARLTGKPAVVLLTAGPGALNSLPGVAQAYHAASPMLHLTGTVALTDGNEALHGVDRSDFLYRAFQDVAKWSGTVDRAEDISEVLARAFHTARSGRPGPVHVDIPEDVMFSRAEVPGYRRPEPQDVGLEPGVVDRVVELLQGASRPIICAGKGVLVCQASDELRQLAETTAAPVAVSREVLGVFPSDHPLYTGFFWKTESDPVAEQFIKDADMVLAVGLRPRTLSADALARLGGDRVAFVGFDGKLGEQPLAQLNANADSQEFLRGLVGALRGREREPSSSLLGQIALRRCAVEEVFDEEVERHRQARPLYLGGVLKEVAKALPANATLLTDIGNTDYGVRAYVPARPWPGYIQPGAWGAMGFALPAAIATKLVHPERPVLGVAGDGALLMGLGELATAVELGLNVVILAINDSRYGMINTLQMKAYGRCYGDALVSPNFAQLAEGFGARGYRVEHLQDIGPALEAAFAGEGPAIVDVICDHRITVPVMSQVGEAARKRWR